MCHGCDWLQIEVEALRTPASLDFAAEKPLFWAHNFLYKCLSIVYAHPPLPRAGCIGGRLQIWVYSGGRPLFLRPFASQSVCRSHSRPFVNGVKLMSG